jgi:hypothetical protein
MALGPSLYGRLCFTHEMTLVFSGVQLPNTTYDAFCVRLMKLKLRNTVR